jgi:hypothetical protein
VIRRPTKRFLRERAALVLAKVVADRLFLTKLISTLWSEGAAYRADHDQARELVEDWHADHWDSLRSFREREALRRFDINRDELVRGFVLLGSGRDPDPELISPGLTIARYLVRRGQRGDVEDASHVLQAVLELVAAHGSPEQFIEAARLSSRVLRHASRADALRALEVGQELTLHEDIEASCRLLFEEAKLRVNFWLDPSLPYDPGLISDVEDALARSLSINDRIFGARWLADLYCLTGRVYEGLARLEEVRATAHQTSAYIEEGYAIRSEVRFRLDEASRRSASRLAEQCESALSLLEGRASPNGIAATMSVRERALRAASLDAAADDLRRQASAIRRSVSPWRSRAS